jgi:hypothetical protein
MVFNIYALLAGEGIGVLIRVCSGEICSPAAGSALLALRRWSRDFVYLRLLDTSHEA